jgi:hypothetical protein
VFIIKTGKIRFLRITTVRLFSDTSKCFNSLASPFFRTFFPSISVNDGHGSYTITLM